MTKTTKKAFFTSLLSLLVCFVMLIGSTFAWFTDSVTSGSNKIVAGNLDVALKHTNAKVSDQTVEQATNLFVDANGNAIKWEPGAMAYETFTIANEGTLALKYKMNMNVTDYNAVTATAKTLLDVLKVKVLTGEDMIASLSREAVAELDWTASQTLGAFEDEGNLYPAGNADNYDTQKVFQVIVYWQPTANDNQWNVKPSETTDGNALYVDFGVAVVAAQLNYEGDSFGPDYDEGTVLPDLPATINKTFTSQAVVLADNETIAADVAIKNSDNTQTVATVPAASAQKLVEKAIDVATDKKDDTDVSTTFALNIETTEIAEEKATYQISLSAIMTYTTNSDVTATKELTSTEVNDALAEADEIVTAVVNIGAGLESVTVKHSGTPMTQLASAGQAAEGYYYDAATGDLTIKTKSFSPFTIEYKNTYVARIGTKGYATLAAAIAAANVNGGTVVLLNDMTVTQSDLVAYRDPWGKPGEAVVPVMKNGAVFDGNGKTITVGDNNMYVFGDVRNSTIKNLTVNYKDVKNGNIVYYTEYATLENISVKGIDTFSSGNAAAFVVYTRYDLTMTNCTNYAKLQSETGDSTMYDAIFIGYALGTGTGTVKMTNCINEGSLVCGKAGMILANWSYAATTLVIDNCKNNGLIQSKFNGYYNGAGAYNYCTSDYWDKSSCLTLQFVGGETYTSSTATKWYDVTAQQSLIGTGSFVVGPTDETLALTLNEDGTFTVTAATVEGVASYVVSIGTYTSTANGSHRTYATETIAADGLLKTTLKNLSFVDAAWVEENEAKAGELAGNVVYTAGGNTYYYVQSPEHENVGGTPRAAQMISVTALDAEGNLLAVAGFIAA